MKREIEAYKEHLRAMIGEIYWQEPPAMYLFQREYMSHWEAAEHADHGVGDDGPGHGESALDMLARHALTEADQERAAAAMRESILVHKYQYDEIGRKAIELTKKSASVNV